MAPVVKFELMDMTTGRINKTTISILEWYVHYRTTWLEPNTPKLIQYRKEMFGVAQLEDTPESFSAQSFYKAYTLTESDFNQMTVPERAKLKAHYFLTNLVDLRRAHMEKMQEARDKKERELKAAAEAKKSKEK